MPGLAGPAACVSGELRLSFVSCVTSAADAVLDRASFDRSSIDSWRFEQPDRPSQDGADARQDGRRRSACAKWITAGAVVRQTES
jgi:hypothetical protein